jgi:hypothetical protein
LILHFTQFDREAQFGPRVGLHAPGMFIARLKRTVASTGGTLVRGPTRTTKLSRVLSWQRHVRAQVVVAAVVPLSLWRPSPTRPLLGVVFPPTSIHQSFFPRMPNRGTPRVGKVGNPESSIRAHHGTARVRGSLCLAVSRIPGDRVRLPKSPS